MSVRRAVISVNGVSEVEARATYRRLLEDEAFHRRNGAGAEADDSRADADDLRKLWMEVQDVDLAQGVLA